jgi:SAM-dependent methyltransferase
VEPNIVYLSEAFNKDNCQFVVGDIEKIHLDKKFDIVFSSLMFKHFMPTFENPLKNITNHMKNNSLIFFDLDEDTSTEIEEMEGTYTGQYTKNQVRKILQNCNLTLINFETVKHTDDRIGLLVIAQKIC